MVLVMFKILNYAFQLICVILVGIVISDFTFRYLENADASSIGFKQFNKSPRDKYPTFSICLWGSKNLYRPLENELENNFGISLNEYSMLLKGVRGPDVRGMDITNISDSKCLAAVPERVSLSFDVN